MKIMDWGDPVAAQEDWYNGIKFRSKLESKTAQALDNIGIPYQYEPDGYKLSNGMWYRPDFWLPGANQYIECKGVMDAIDSAKIVGLVEDTNKSVLVVSYDNAMLVKRFFDNPNDPVVTYDSGILLCECTVCHGLYFLATEDIYTCTSCGAYDGDHYVMEVADIESGQGLFAYGQKVASDKPIYKEIAERFNQ